MIMQYIDVHKVADEAKFNKFHAKVLAWCFIIIIIDGYDIAVAGAALPSIAKFLIIYHNRSYGILNRF